MRGTVSVGRTRITFLSTSPTPLFSLLPSPGIHHPLPPGYRAYLLPPPHTDDAGMAIDAPPSSTSSRTFTATASWPGLISWALDAVPSAGDPARRALDWVGVAEACAGHIGAAAVTQALAMESACEGGEGVAAV